MQMNRLFLVFLLTAAGIGKASAANDMIWVFDHDEASGYAGVIAAVDKNAEQPFETLAYCPPGIVNMRVERGEIRKLAGPRKQFE